jgi:hypothetical protein
VYGDKHGSRKSVIFSWILININDLQAEKKAVEAEETAVKKAAVKKAAQEKLKAADEKVRDAPVSGLTR